ncbi:MAG: SMC-Scp complex subunit ScpB [Candidatus Kapaibacterium sp.]
MAIPFFFTLSRERQRKTLEALIFASDEPLTNKILYKVLVLEEGLNAIPEQAQHAEGTDTPEATETEAQAEPNADAPAQVTIDGTVETLPVKKNLPDVKQLAQLADELVEEINDELYTTERPYKVVRIAGGYQFATTSDYGEFVARLMKSRTKRRLSQAALEVLSIVAYKQPVTKPEIEAIRGVNSNEVINALVEKDLVTISGRSEAVGKPLLYGTTDEFLRTFGLHSLNDLPKLRELDDLFKNKARELAGELDISVKTTSEEIIEKVQSMVENEARLEEAHHHAEEEQPEPVEQEVATELMGDVIQTEPNVEPTTDEQTNDVERLADAE